MWPIRGLRELGELAPAEETADSFDRGNATVLPSPTPSPSNVSLPLLVAMNHEGNPFDNDLLGGFTGIPTNMAIGATWQPNYAQEIGRITGQELAAVGVNMLLGPTLDVLENPNPANPADLGTNAYGGNSYDSSS